jgi:hypothetical protein
MKRLDFWLWQALFGPSAMSDLSPECAQKRTTLVSRCRPTSIYESIGPQSLSCLAERSRSITPIEGSAATKRASGVSSGILGHQAADPNYCVEN